MQHVFNAVDNSAHMLRNAVVVWRQLNDMVKEFSVPIIVFLVFVIVIMHRENQTKEKQVRELNIERQ